MCVLMYNLTFLKYPSNSLKYAYHTFSFVVLKCLIFSVNMGNLGNSDWVSFLAYPNLFGIKGFVVVVVVICNVYI
jgi:hypothetical protein